MIARLLLPCALVASVGAAGCKSASPCASSPAMNDLLTQAVLVRVDVYDGSTTHCAGTIADGHAPPLLSHTFAGGAAVRLDLPPGARTIVMTTFSDTAGTITTGSACTEANLSGGKSACLSLSLSPIGDVACGSDDDCAAPDGGAPSRSPKCDPRRHQCVACVDAGDCPAGEECSPAGQCAAPCDPSGACPGSRSCCDGFCIDAATDPFNCGACGGACMGASAMCCASQCVTAASSVDNCGGCGNVCDTTHSNGATCPASTCLYDSCPAGRADCNQTAPNLDGCECATPVCCGNGCQPTHLNGIGQNYLDNCVPPGTPGTASTYTLEMATAARAAAMAGTDSTKSCGNGANATNCLTRDFGATCATWCYDKSIAGRVATAPTCMCPTASSPAWN